MNESREALLTRFRSTLRARVRRLALLFEATARAAWTEGEREGALVELHTLKGEARMLGLTRLAALAHDLESRASERGFGAAEPNALEEMWLALEEGAPSAGESSESQGSSRNPGGATALGLVRLEPILNEFSRDAKALAEQSGKALRVEVRALGVKVERAALDSLCAALLHLLQNAVDHGLELPHERGGKPRVGRLELAAEVQGPELVLTVEDDGRGIDLEAIRAAAAQRGASSASRAAALGERELLELLFEQGLSTRADATLLSGRGVGLCAVRRCVQSLGGRVAIETEVGRGTRFVLWVPIASDGASAEAKE